MCFLAFEPFIRHQAEQESLLRVCHESFAVGRNGFLGRVELNSLCLWRELVYVGRLSLPVVPRDVRLSRLNRLRFRFGNRKCEEQVAACGTYLKLGCWLHDVFLLSCCVVKD